MNKPATTYLTAGGPRLNVRSRATLAFGPQILLPLTFLTIFLAFSSADPLLVVACIVVLVVAAKLIWRVGEPPILFAAFFLQWIQVSLLVIQAAIAGVPITDYHPIPGIVTATWLSLAGLLVLAGGMRMMIGGAVSTQRLSEFQAEVRQYNLRRAFVAYVVAEFVVLFIFDNVMWIYPGLSQLLLALSNLKWAFFFALAVIVMVQRRGYVLLAAAFAFELVLGFMSFFSDFKQVFFVIALAAVTARPKVNVRFIFASLPLIGVILVLFAAWSDVKMQYRNFLNGGTGQQIVIVGPTERISKIVDLIWNQGLPNLGAGFDLLVQRVEYTFYFGAVVDYVPAATPHANGAIWEAALSNVLEPRLLFPDKPPLQPDVINTQKYTGINLTLSGTSTDTEIPMGYMAESYVDFGYSLMFVPIFMLGLLYGAQYRYLANLQRYRLFAYGAMPVVLQSASEFGLTAVKILGGSLTAFGATYIAFRLFVPSIHRAILMKRKLSQS